MNYKKFLSVFVVALSVSSSTALSMIENNLDLNEGITYRIKNKESGNFLYHNENKIGMSIEENKFRTHWKVEKTGTSFKIKKGNMEEFLFLWGMGNAIFMEDLLEDQNDEYITCQYWNLEKNGEHCKIKNSYSEQCLSSVKKETAVETATMQVNTEDDFQLWSFIPVEK